MLLHYTADFVPRDKFEKQLRDAGVLVRTRRLFFGCAKLCIAEKTERADARMNAPPCQSKIDGFSERTLSIAALLPALLGALDARHQRVRPPCQSFSASNASLRPTGRRRMRVRTHGKIARSRRRPFNPRPMNVERTKRS